MKTFRLIYILIGILLAAGVIFTSLRGLPEKDRELYEMARMLEDGRSEQIWPGLYISGYPVAIRKGDAEYVIFKGEVNKQKPLLPVIACTAYPADDGVYVLMPSKSMMDSLGQIVEGFASGLQSSIIDQFSINSKKISDNQYISILYHETMHALQFSLCKEKIIALAGDIGDADLEGSIAELESDPAVQTIYKKQAELLYRLVASDNDIPDAAAVREYIRMRKDTQALLSSKAGIDEHKIISYTDLYELLEGTARYAEAKTALVLSDNELYRNYLQSLQETVYGREKYYRSGMGICMLLDRMNPGWKQDLFTGSLSLAEMLEDAVEGSYNGGEKVYDPAG